MESKLNFIIVVAASMVDKEAKNAATCSSFPLLVHCPSCHGTDGLAKPVGAVEM
jgi:hypothetical protein